MIITAGGHRGHRPLSEEVFVCSAGLTIREVDKIEVTVDRLGEITSKVAWKVWLDRETRVQGRVGTPVIRRRYRNPYWIPCSSSDGFVQRDGTERKGLVELCGKGNSDSATLLEGSLKARKKVQDREHRS